jgi:uncharacterized delta-60 repeat protein
MQPQMQKQVSAASFFGASRRNARLALERLEDRNLPSLMLDPTFTYPDSFPRGHVFVNHNGEGAAMDIQRDGKIVMGGFTFEGLNNRMDMALSRHNPDGTPDPTFNADGNSDGVIYVSFYRTGREIIRSVVIQNVNAEPRILVAGEVTPPGSATTTFGVMRLLADGSLDPSFGCPTPGTCSGKVTIPFQTSEDPPFNSVAYSLALQADGKILVAGVTNFVPGQPGRKFAVARLSENGGLDPTFGNAGQVVLRVNNQNEARSVILTPPDAITGTQKILLCGGDALTPGAGNFAIAQLEADGSLDTDEFAAEASNRHKGVRLIDFPEPGINHDDRAWDMVLQPAEGGGYRIVVVGDTLWNPGTGDRFRDFALARLLPNGDLDLSFGDSSDGKRTLNVGYEDIASGVTLQPLGSTNEQRIVIAGRSFFQTEPSTPAFMSGARFSADANEPSDQVETFRSHFPETTGHADGAMAVKVWNNKIVAAGFHTGPDSVGFAAIRLCDAPCGRGLTPPPITLSLISGQEPSRVGSVGPMMAPLAEAGLMRESAPGMRHHQEETDLLRRFDSNSIVYLTYSIDSRNDALGDLLEVVTGKTSLDDQNALTKFTRNPLKNRP